jgi:hypothetical protein
MKIAVLTLPLHTNYGGILQAYALNKVLTDKGNEVYHIDIPKNYDAPFSKMAVTYAKRFVKKFVLRKPGERIFYEIQERTEYPVLSQYTRGFVSEHISKRLVLVSIDDFPQDQFDAVVVGSDQIWRPKYFSNIQDAYFRFVKRPEVKRISYAPSFGAEEWEYSESQTAECSALAKKFTAISVRENSGAELCKKHLGVDATHVLDPTMLLSKEVYTDIVKDFTPSDGDLLTYILDESAEKTQGVEFISKQKGLTPFSVGHKHLSEDHSAYERIVPPVERWLRGYVDTKFIVTDSFHACAFSIIFNKPFIVYANKKRGVARFKSLLSIFGLEDRIVYSSSEITEQLVNAPIDWERVNGVLEQWKKKSNEFIDNAIK